MSKWHTARLADLAQWTSGGTPRTSEPSYWDGDIPWISAASLKDFFISNSDRNVTAEGAANGTRLVPSGTTIFIVRGMSLMSEFKIGITVREVAFGQDCKALIPNQGIDPFFLAYAIKAQTPTILNLVDAAGHGTGRLQTDRIAALKIPIPTNQSEQVQVASMVKSLDNKIAVNDRIAGTVDSLLKASYVAISQSTRQEVRLGRLIELKYGKALREENRIPGQIPVFGGNGISGSHNVPLNGGPGIIVGRKGANAGSVSWSQGPFWAIDTSFYVELRSEAIPLEFLLFLLEDAGLRNLVGDSAIPGLNREIALSLTVRVPADDVVQLFAETARPLLALNEQITQESRSVAELRNTLLPKLMSGEIRVRDAEKVVEDVT